MIEENEEKIDDAEERSGELEDLRRYIEDLTSFLPLAFCMVNPLDYILDINQSFEEITGHAKMDVIGNNIDFLFENKGKLESFIARVANKNSIVEEEMNLLTKGGRTIPVKVSALSRRDSEDNFSGYFLTITDITETKRFEEELEKKISERTEELERAKEKLEESEAVLEVKVKARTRELKELNNRLEERVRERTKKLEENAKKLKEKAKETEHTQTALLNIAEDNERALKEAQYEKQKTLSIIKNFIDGLLLFDSKNRLIMVNPKGSEMLGFETKEALKRSVEELKKFPSFKKIIEEVIGDDIKDVFRKEVEIDEDVFYEITTTPIKNNEEKVGTLVSVHDITREKSIEKIKSEFVSVAAHQLRTPLAGIKWTLQAILEEEEEANIPEEIIGFIQKAYEANDRMVNLVNDLLNVTRIEEGRYAYKPKKEDIKEIVEPYKEDYKDKIEQRGLKFRVEETKEDIPPVVVDKEKIGLIVQNFLDNAMKYSKEGEIVLTVDFLKEEKKVKVSVLDSGVGIPEEMQERMFSKFFRAPNVQRMDTEGSGLGLFIAKNIVEAHKGEIGFESKEGEGSTFYFTLPVSEDEMTEFMEGL